jgi:hypothetical protein
MAYDIKDNLITKHALNNINLITDWISNKIGQIPIIEYRTDVIMILIKCNGFEDYGEIYNGRPVPRSNTVSFYEDSILVNPFIDKDGNPLTKELEMFIRSIPVISRDNIIKNIIDEIR